MIISRALLKASYSRMQAGAPALAKNITGRDLARTCHSALTSGARRARLPAVFRRTAGHVGHRRGPLAAPHDQRARPCPARTGCGGGRPLVCRHDLLLRPHDAIQARRFAKCLKNNFACPCMCVGLFTPANRA